MLYHIVYLVPHVPPDLRPLDVSPRGAAELAAEPASGRYTILYYTVLCCTTTVLQYTITHYIISCSSIL